MIQTLRGLAPLAFGLACFLGIGVLYVWLPQVYFPVMRGLMGWPESHPFVDSEFMYAMKKCWQEGADIYVSVPCDAIPGNRMAYSPLWPRLPFLPTDLAWTVPVGIITNLISLASLYWLPRCHSFREIILVCLAIISPMVVFALERNNIDVWTYDAVWLAGLFFVLTNRMEAIYAVSVIAGLLKYYPLCIMYLSLAEPYRRFAVVNGLAALCVAAFGVIFWDEIRGSLRNVPQADLFARNFFDYFGIVKIPIALATIITKVYQLTDTAGSGLQIVFRLGLSAWLLTFAIRKAQHAALRDALHQMPRADRFWLTLGATVVVFCYLAGQNNSYRGIFFLPVLTGLIALARTSGGNRHANLPILCVILMWSGHISFAALALMRQTEWSAELQLSLVLGISFVREIAWLYLMGVLLAVLVFYAQASATPRALLSLLGMTPSAGRAVSAEGRGRGWREAGPP